MQKMRAWKRELWDALTSVDRHVRKRAEEDHRELSDGEKKNSVNAFKQSYMPTREAARAVLDPRYAGHCLGTDINKLACEGLLSEAPSVLKVGSLRNQVCSRRANQRSATTRRRRQSWTRCHRSWKR